MDDEVKKIYGNGVRVRAVGVCIQDNAILLVKHRGLGPKDVLWAPPGGGVAFLENAQQTLTREFKEEVNLDIVVKELLFVNEFIEKPLHAIELFFEVEVVGGELRKGRDPEHSDGHQIIDDVRFVTFKEIELMNNDKLHNALHNINDQDSFLNMRGYFQFYP